ncbi:hypothetical protein Mpal_1575 [Methanosphaerula palustris E1-9c]|uniref:Uncharacterized protein n=1 Tax=Methanosphaerula palustris (strain ATCC BAA-1556 / DSM 19958 / E1-9c) TaxID=521011 RepID=B8GIS5_METPE|nr:hypothetical protein Mpal_1575 [Methanosphaerula palustris E1-9c]
MTSIVLIAIVYQNWAGHQRKKPIEFTTWCPEHKIRSIEKWEISIGFKSNRYPSRIGSIDVEGV